MGVTLKSSYNTSFSSLYHILFLPLSACNILKMLKNFKPKKEKYIKKKREKHKKKKRKKHKVDGSLSKKMDLSTEKE